jgi:hypothetical protein
MQMIIIITHHPPDLESYFARSLGFTLLTISLLTLLLTGLIPAVEFPEDSSAALPFANPTIFVTTSYHILAGIYMYLSYSQGGTASQALGALTSGVFAAMGGWCLMFANDSHISRRTGADKRMSGWPFKNDVADKRKGGKKAL